VVPATTPQCRRSIQRYVFKGKIQFRGKGEEIVAGAGNGFYLAPGHTGEALEDTEVMVLSPTGPLKDVQSTLQN